MDDFLSLKPKNEFLRDYIETFYFHKSKNEEEIKRIVFFPNTKNALTIYKNIKYKFNDQKRIATVKKSTESNYTYFFLGIQKSYIISEIESPFDKIGIIFKPLGLNYFLTKPLNQVKEPEKLEFNYFESKLNPIIQKIYLEVDELKRMELLERFFLDNFKDNNDLNLLNKAIMLIENGDEKRQINQISKELKISSKTLNRLFKKHLNCTPKHYSNVHFFRKAIEEFEKEKYKKMTDIALNNNYFDQSDFIKSFKRHTGIQPTKFFKQIENFGNNIFWLSN